MNSRRILPFVLLLLTPLVGRTDDAIGAASRSIADKCDEYMTARVKVMPFSGSVLVGKNGKIEFTHGYGFANREYEIPNSPLTKFRLASISKQFVAVGIMILEHEGKLKTDDPLKKHLPDAPKAWGDVTIHHLMTHTGGIPENLRPALFKGQWPQPTSVDRLLDIVKDKPLDFKPGEKWSYSNTGYALLGMIIEKISGKAYGDFLHERIFSPLGMLDTGVDSQKLILKNRASPYAIQRGEHVHAAIIDPSQVYAAGMIYSTVEDLLKWDEALYTERILPRKSLERMWTPAKDNYGYGWIIVHSKGKKTITHSGSLPGFKNLATRFPDDHVFVTVLTNVDGPAFGPISRDLAAIARNEPYDVPVVRTEVKLDPKKLEGLVGDYELQPKLMCMITLRDGKLRSQLTGDARLEILPQSDSLFFCRVPEFTIEFKKDASGKATDIVFHQNGRDLKGKRVDKKPDDKKPDDKKPDDKKPDDKKPDDKKPDDKKPDDKKPDDKKPDDKKPADSPKKP